MAVDEAQHADLGADIVRWSLEESPRLVGAALRAAARRLPDHLDPPITHLRFRSSEVRSAGLADAVSARQLWSAQKTEALGWLDEVLAAEGIDTHLSGHAQLAS